MRGKLLTGILFTLACCLPAADADWMWAAGERLAPGDVEFRRTFRIGSPLEGDVWLRVLGEFCGFEVELNGQSVVRGEPYDPAVQVLVQRWLRVGENQITIRATGVEGPSALALEIAGADPGGPVVSSGAGWDGGVAIAPVEAWRLGGARIPAIGVLDEYNQWREATGAAGEATFSPLPEGFSLERVRSAGPDDGSWISMAFDPRGRLVISKEKRGLFRLDLGEGGAGEPEMVDDTLLECRGLLFVDGSLYANANNSHGLYRLRDTNGDDQYDDVQLLMGTEGGVGHGRNDLALGPDGLIYSIHGDSVQLPTQLHRLVPAIPGGRGEQGYLVRFDTEGNHRELVAIGLRNPYGIAFDPDGEAFTYDADNEGDIGLPLYRPARVNHLVSGGNYGWQQGRDGSWPVYYPDSLPTTFDAGRGSPTAVEFGTKSNFPPRYRDALFILDWAYGRIIAIDLIPLGASYTCRPETFLRGRPLNVTDLAFGPDGALYFITGGRGTQSALYRIRYDGGAAEAREPDAQDRARDGFSRAARASRRSLERFHGRAAPEAITQAWPELENPDPWIRNAARIAVESQPVDSWRDRATDGEPNVTALLALSRLGQEVAGKTLTCAFASLPRHDKLGVLRILEIGIDRSPPADLRDKIRSYLAPLFPDGDAQVDRELAKLLVDLGEQGATAKALTLLAGADSQSDRLHYLQVLSHARDGWTPDGRRAFFSAIRHPEYFRGDSNMPGFLLGIRQRAVASLSAGERATLQPLLEPAAADLGVPPPKPRAVVRHWEIDDLTAAPPDGYTRDSERGREIFEQALCSRCHQAGGLGVAVGPDLSAVAGRFSRRDLIEAIVDPSRAMAEIFRNLIVEKKDGTTVVGRVVRDDFRESTISISINPFAPSELAVIPKGDIASHQDSPVSPMPPGLLDTFSKEEIFQLLDFLAGGGG